jgi:hypothetical protein
MAKKSSNNPESETSELITVRVIRQPLCEDGTHYGKGDTFAVTPERAAALGELVEVAEPTPEA